jgi:general secretion pathway protein I
MNRPNFSRAPSRPAAAERRSEHGFTLLEVMIALAILAISLVALSDINAGAIAMHSYAKKLTVATFLAKGKMLDIESKLDAEGFPAEKDNIEPSEGNFEDEGFPDYKWSVEVVAPNSENLDPMKLVSAILGGGSGADGSGSPGSNSGSNSSSSSNPLGALGLGGGSSTDPNNPLAGSPLMGLLGGLTGMGGMGGGNSSSGSGASGMSGLGGLGGLAQGAMSMQATQMVDQITKMLREVRLTVTWPNGKDTESFTVVTHMISMGPNTPLGGTSNSGTKTIDPTKVTPTNPTGEED